MKLLACLFVCMIAGAALADSPKWEYATILVGVADTNPRWVANGVDEFADKIYPKLGGKAPVEAFRKLAGTDKVLALMNAAGGTGWEFTEVTSESDTSGTVIRRTYWLKRRLP